MALSLSELKALTPSQLKTRQDQRRLPLGERADPPSIAPVNSTPLSRFLTRAAVRFLWTRRPHYGRLLFLTSRICIKQCDLMHLSEATTMEFLRKHTSLPIPKVYCAFKHGNRTYIVMERIRGRVIVDGWLQRTDESRAQLLAQLKGYLDEMRALEPPVPGMVQGVYGSKLEDFRVGVNGIGGYGPFPSVSAFHHFLVSGIGVLPGGLPDMNRLAQFYADSTHKACFTHGDLSALNILVKGDKVVGIIDWEMAGWYPEYWEYSNAWNVHPYLDFWRDEVPKYLDAYPREVEMDLIRRRWFGDI